MLFPITPIFIVAVFFSSLVLVYKFFFARTIFVLEKITVFRLTVGLLLSSEIQKFLLHLTLLPIVISVDKLRLTLIAVLTSDLFWLKGRILGEQYIVHSRLEYGNSELNRLLIHDSLNVTITRLYSNTYLLSTLGASVSSTLVTFLMIKLRQFSASKS